MKENGYFWYSEEQYELARMIDRSHSTNYCIIDGTILKYSEWKNDKGKSIWRDAVFLGKGKYHHSERGI